MPEEPPTTIDEDLVEKQGIHALARGYMLRPGERAIEILFPPSRFAEAAFALMNRTEKKRLFNDLLARIDAGSEVAAQHPGIVDWIEDVRKNGRKYWDGNPAAGRTPSYDLLEHDILHFEVQPVREGELGGLVSGKEIVHIDELGNRYVEKDGIRIQAHRHLYSANLSKAVQLRALTGEKGELGIVAEETPYGNFNLRIKSKRGGRQKDTLSYWLVSLSNPFEADLEDRFMVDNQADFETYLGSKGQLWCNYDGWVLQKLDELRRQKGISTAQRETKIIGFHTAVALTKLFLEKRKQPEERRVTFLAVDEGKDVLMPFVFVDNPALSFEPVVNRYGRGMHYEEIDDGLLDNREGVTSYQFKRLFGAGRVSLEAVKNIRGMLLKETRNIIQRQHLEFAKDGYRFSGFAVELDESRGENGFRTIGIVYTGGNRKSATILYSEGIAYPLLHIKSFTQHDGDALYGEERVNGNRNALQRFLPGRHPLLQLEQLFEERDYRTGLPCQGRLVLPPVLREQEKQLYADWLARLQR